MTITCMVMVILTRALMATQRTSVMTRFKVSGSFRPKPLIVPCLALSITLVAASPRHGFGDVPGSCFPSGSLPS